MPNMTILCKLCEKRWVGGWESWKRHYDECSKLQALEKERV